LPQGFTAEADRIRSVVRAAPQQDWAPVDGEGQERPRHRRPAQRYQPRPAQSRGAPGAGRQQKRRASR
jgi:hypothetical protein